MRLQDGTPVTFIPDDFECFWDGYHDAGGWSDCANLNMSNSIKIAEITTPNGTIVKIPENQRLTKDPEPTGPSIAGKTYEMRYGNGAPYSEIRRISFTKDSVYFTHEYYENGKKSDSYTLKDRYNYRNRQIMSGLRMGISEDGKMVQYDSYELYLVK